MILLTSTLVIQEKFLDLVVETGGGTYQHLGFRNKEAFIACEEVPPFFGESTVSRYLFMFGIVYIGRIEALCSEGWQGRDCCHRCPL